MDIYIDYNCFVSFLNSKKDRDYYECEKLLKYHLHINFTFPKERLRLEEEDILLKFGSFMEFRGQNEQTDTWGVESPYGLLDNPKYLSSVFLIDTDEGDCTIGDPDGRVIVGNQYNTIETIKRLFVDSCFNLVKKIDLKDFRWDDLVISQCSDIIITDRYFIENCNKNSKYTANFKIYFGKLSRINHRINLVIFSSSSKDGGTEYTDEQINMINKKILDCFDSKRKPNLTLVLCNRQRPSESSDLSFPHDRCIISNYRAFYCGDSFSGLFIMNHGIRPLLISQGYFVEVVSLANLSDYNMSNGIITKLSNVARRANVIGDRVSNIIRW